MAKSAFDSQKMSGQKRKLKPVSKDEKQTVVEHELINERVLKSMRAMKAKLVELEKSPKDSLFAKQTKQELTKMTTVIEGLEQKVVSLQQKLKGFSARNGHDEIKSSPIVGIGKQFREAFVKQHGNEIRRGMSFGFTEAHDEANPNSYAVRKYLQKNITSASDSAGPLTDTVRRPGIYMPPDRALRLLDIIPVFPTSQNSVEYVRQKTFTSNAGPQYLASTQETEGVEKNQSDLDFELITDSCITVAHWMRASKQILSDVPQLEAFIRYKLSYGLRREIEDQVINGDGTGGNLTGLIEADCTTPLTGATSNDTNIDLFRRAIAQLEVGNFEPDVVMMHPLDWADMELLKDSENRYILNNVYGAMTKPWGLNIVTSTAITQGTAYVGAIAANVALLDREGLSVNASSEDGDNFRKNLITMLAEARLGFQVTQEDCVVEVLLA